mmetsp:Transcript_30606/g.5513  ORF Transcript_30606/g.5513 Transcript_30606/m.5513 type:complete len:112 (+) Transcript_30606:49-384(+)
MFSKHAGIVAWAMSKAQITSQLGFSGTELGLMDCAYLFCAALSNLLAGNLVYRFSARVTANLSIFLLACIYIALILMSYVTNFSCIYVIFHGLAGLCIGPLLASGVSLCDN